MTDKATKDKALVDKFNNNRNSYIMLHRTGNFNIKFTLEEIVKLAQLVEID